MDIPETSLTEDYMTLSGEPSPSPLFIPSVCPFLLLIYKNALYIKYISLYFLITNIK